MLGTYAAQFTRLNSVERAKNRWNENQEILPAIGLRSDEYNAEALICERLLVPKISIHGDEYVELSRRAAKQLTVLNATPSAA